MAYQSHHQGIETPKISLLVAPAHTYQSHHQGIETKNIYGFIRLELNYQSHHQGIETPQKGNPPQPQKATNRTIKELKQVKKR